MAVLKMQRLGICAWKKNRKQILELLQRRGVLDIDTDSAEDEVFKKTDTSREQGRFEQNIQLIEGALEILKKYVPEQKSIFSSLEGKTQVDSQEYRKMESAGEVLLKKAERIENLSGEIKECEEGIRSLENERDSLDPWKNLQTPMDFPGTKKTRAIIGTFPGQILLEQLCESVERALPEGAGYYAEVVFADNAQSGVFILAKKEDAAGLEETLRSEGFSRPSRQEHTKPLARQEELTREIEKLTEKKKALEQEMLSFGEEREELKLAADYYRIRRERYEILGSLLQSKRTFLVTGYVPEKNADALAKELSGKFSLALELADPQKEEEPPVLLANRTVPSSFEGVVAAFGLPKKGEIDPTTVMSACYIFLFGLMLSDAAYGFLVFAGCLAALLKFPRMEEGMRKALRMFMYCGISTMFWGVMFGSYFGDVVDVVSENFFGKKITIPALWFVPLNDPMKMLVYSMLFGVIHLFLGLAMKGYMLLRDRKYLDFVCDVVFWYLLLGGLILILLPSEMFRSISQMEFVFPPTLNFFAKFAAVFGAAGILLMSGRERKNWFLRVALGAYDLYGVTSWLSDVLSYSRLLALGLATSVIGTVINSMGAMLGSGIPGAIGFLLVFLIGHSVNIGINLLGAYVHTNRLQYVEFFGKFYEGGGRPFNPFCIKTNYVEIKEENE
ncbi:MAG TPA: V-type ATP synthase subunit I [Candidatus Blautia faecigallinarum]|uniref:V-type ATP synthase subunit I n=1 Tax=Candidatus Blautia faecigallinarum TaxID=2838488 RepID=A0A9D2ITN6_9FIRM|nr:V-type ATP synthase subunit I [Candidatus Blautia faecigallinarum]